MNRLIRTVALSLPLLALAGCTVNPATGKQSFTSFMSPADEKVVGREEHPKILKQSGGAYGDRDLDAYMRNVGQLLARVSETPSISYTFTVLNDPKVNAFALPGGYVYVTRGLFALADNEAEKAGVLAHEIGHVVARHTAECYSQAMAANLGMSILGALGNAAGVPTGLGSLASFGAQAYLQGFSREQELEADMLGVRYMTRAGYDPRAMISFLRKLQDHDALEAALSGKRKAADRLHIMSTHPRTADRIVSAIELAKVRPAARPRVGRAAYLARIDGMVFGDPSKQGIRKGRVFVHPQLAIQFMVPPGFVMFNTAGQVIARGPGGAAIAFDMKRGQAATRLRSLPAYLVRDWGSRFSLRAVERITINAMEAATARARLQTQAGPRDVRLLVIRERPDRIYRFLFISPPSLTARLINEYKRTTYSFRRLSPEEASSIEPLRLGVVTVNPGDTAKVLAARMPLGKFSLAWFETLNGLGGGRPLVPGRKVKVVVE